MVSWEAMERILSHRTRTLQLGQEASIWIAFEAMMVVRKTNMRWIGGVVLGFLLAQVASDSQTPIERVEFCELLKNPDRYNGKEVTVRASHRYGFEWTYLYCLGCKNDGHIWFDVSGDIDTESEKTLQAAHRKGAGIVNLTVTGVFKTGGSYGHLGGYRHMFVVRKAWDVVVLSQGMKGSAREKEIEEKWACGGANPK